MGKQNLEGRRDISKGFTISDADESGGTYWYYGYINVHGGWQIMRIKSDETEYRYAYGPSDYDTAWTNKATQNYKKIA